jgi:TolB protein
MDLDGSDVIQLTDHPGSDKYPSVSPDGKKIAYTSDIGGNWQIVIMNWDGSDKIQLTDTPVRSGFPTWSFDGRYIFYEVYKDGDWEIYRINTDGTQIKRMTFNTEGDDWHPFAHPYKQLIFFESGAVGYEDIYTMNFDGGNIQRVSDKSMRKRVPTVSRDGTFLVFMSYKGDDYYLYSMDIDGENINRIPGAPANCGHPSISPDNKYLVFQVRTNSGSDINDVYIMGLDGSGLTQLTDLPGNDWDPVFMYQIQD